MKRFRMFAGPNGSGKSTFIKAIQKECSIGFYINADDIEQALKKKGELNCCKYTSEKLNQGDWIAFVKINSNDERFATIDLDAISIEDNILSVSSSNINSYLAAVIAEFFRYRLVESDESFSFETVMSHVSKVQFLDVAKQKGFKTYLYFICTSDPEINKNRVKIRVSKGGHNVADDKIEKRYYASLNLLKDAFLAVDRAYICDSSVDNEEQSILCEKIENKVKFHRDRVPQWLLDYLVNHIHILDV